MTAVTILLVAAGAAAGSWVLTRRLRQYAIARRVLDVPNARSLHEHPTPRGGGMAIVASASLAFAALATLALMPWELTGRLCAAGAIVAGIGFADDHRPVKRRWRLLAHIVAAVVVIAPMGSRAADPLELGSALPQGVVVLAAIAFIVWLINLTNFMDGIDGIAALEAVTVCIGGAMVYLVVAPQSGHWAAPLALAAAACGFLAWNWPPARIFMGDGGSGFLGLTLAGLALHAGTVQPPLFASWLILLAVFITDATLTLSQRLTRGAPIYEAHRTHAYQHAALRWRRHKPVTVAVGVINLIWLLPLAIAVGTGRLHPLMGFAAAYLPLIVVAWRLGAGTPASTDSGRGLIV